MKALAQSARATAARIVTAVLADGQSLTRAAPPLLAALGDERDRAFSQLCVYGVLRHHAALSGVLGRLLERPLRERDTDIGNLLLAALYQLGPLALPAHAVVSATVEAVRALGKPWASGLVNGVLRTALRRALPGAAVPGDPVRELPVWLIERLRADWPDDWQAVAAASNRQGPLCLRVNRLRTTVSAYLETLATAGLTARRGTHAPDAVVLDTAVGVERLPGFADGLATVQDEAAQLAAVLLEPRPGQRILDACAAPGGKAGHLLECLAGSGSVVAVERDPARAADIGAQFTRLGLSGEVVIADAAMPATWWDGEPFARILVDAPCSATGVIRRHPDIRFHRRDTDIAPLAARQATLLAALWPLLAADGVLVYATCSVLRAENDAIVARLRERTADAALAPIAATWGHATAYGRQILPGEDDMDGFYYARLRKVPAP